MAIVAKTETESGQDDIDCSEAVLMGKAAFISQMHLRHIGAEQQAHDEVLAEWIAQGLTEQQANRSTMFLMNVNARRMELCGGDYPTQVLLTHGVQIICLLIEKLHEFEMLDKARSETVITASGLQDGN